MSLSWLSVCHNEKMFLSSFFSPRVQSIFTYNQEAVLNSLSVVKIIIRENKGAIFLQKEKFSL